MMHDVCVRMCLGALSARFPTMIAHVKPMAATGTGKPRLRCKPCEPCRRCEKPLPGTASFAAKLSPKFSLLGSDTQTSRACGVAVFVEAQASPPEPTIPIPLHSLPQQLRNFGVPCRRSCETKKRRPWLSRRSFLYS